MTKIISLISNEYSSWVYPAWVLNLYPEHLYETRWFQYLSSLGMAIGAWSLMRSLVFSDVFWITIGLIFYIGSYVFDVYATGINSSLKAHFDELNLKFPIGESNPFLSDNPSWRELLFNWSALISLLLLPVIVVLPEAGLSIGVGRLIATANSLRQNRRLHAMLEMER